MTTESVSSRFFSGVLRPIYLTATRLLVRACGFLSPKLVKFLHYVSSDVAGEIASSRYLAPEHNHRFDVGGTKFILEVSAAPRRVQKEYGALSKDSELYEPVMVHCLTRLLKSMDQPRFMDLGAFMGYYACYVARLLDDAHPVYAVESNPAYCDGIERSSAMNGFKHLKTYNAVLSDRREHAVISGVTVRYDLPLDEGAMTLTLDDLCRENSIKPNIIKMDVHGAEGKIFFGMKELLRDSVQHLLLELHPYYYLEKFSPGYTRTDILALLDELGFSVFYVAGHRIAPSEKSRECIRSGRFAYKRIVPDTAGELLFDRQGEVFLLVSRQTNIETIIDNSLSDPFLC